MRRIALFSDIHANSVALDAVLDDIERAGLCERYCLGDLIGYGPDPAGVVARIRESGIPTIPGNYDEGVAARRGECGCYYATDAAREDGAESYRFTDGMLSAEDAAWILSLPSQRWLEPGGDLRAEADAPRILLTHGSPRKINEYLMPDRTVEQLGRLAVAAGADVVCHGHVHIPYHRSFAAPDGSGLIHYVSSGSVGKPKDGDPRGCWVELLLGDEAAVRESASEDPAAGSVGKTGLWLGTVVHRVDYDIDSVVGAMQAAGLPERLGEALRRA